MSKILKIALKEINLIRSQKMAMFLVLLYPIIIILVLLFALGGPAFFGDSLGSTGIEELNLGVYVPQDSAFFDYESFYSKINESGNLNIIVFNSTDSLKKSLARGESDLGIMLEEPKSKSEALKAKILYDNVSLYSSSSVTFLAESKIREITSSTSKETLAEIWGELESVQLQLIDERKKIDDYLFEFGNSNRKIRDVENDLDKINLSTVRNDLSDFDQKSDYYSQRIEEARGNLSESQNKLNSYEQDIEETRSDLIGYREQLVSIRDAVANAKNNSVEPAKSQLQDIEDDLNEQIAKIDVTLAKLDNAQQDIQAARSQLYDADSKLVQGRNDLEGANITVTEFSRMIDSAEESITGAKSFISETKDSQEDTRNKLEANKELLTNLVQRIAEFRSLNPDLFVQPVEISKEALFDARALDVIIVISIVVVLLLTSILLTGVSTVLEREQGMAFRASMSTTGKPTWVFGKILGQIIFVSIISVLIVSISLLLLGTPMLGGLFDLFIALTLIPFSFICLSLFIARFANTFSAIVLASLLIIIPMLLLSGTLFPIEFMPKIVAVISGILPLTVAKDLLLNIMLRGIPITEMLGQVTILSVYSFLFLGVYLIGKKI